MVGKYWWVFSVDGRLAVGGFDLIDYYTPRYKEVPMIASRIAGLHAKEVYSKDLLKW